MFFAMQYPHWMMIAGAALIAIDLSGFALNQNRNREAAEKPARTKK